MQAMNSILNQEFDPSNEDFLDQILSTPLPSAWPDLATEIDGGQNSGSGGSSFGSLNSDVDASVQALYNELAGTLQGSGQAFDNHLHLPQDGRAHPSQRVRARRGQATDPHSIAERLRRERIAERMKALQELVPNANKTDKASMLAEIIDYVKFLQLQLKRKSMPTSTLINVDNVMETQVAKLMEDNMGLAMQYLQEKSICIMPISLATAISTATGRNPIDHRSDGDNAATLANRNNDA